MVVHLKSLNRITMLGLMCALLYQVGGASLANAEGTVDAIKGAGKITVGTEAHYPPLEFFEDGKIVGYGKDILDSVVADMGVELNQLELPWQGILPGILAKKFDLVATSVTITEERAKKYAFTAPIALYQTALIKRAGDDSLVDLENLNGKVVGVELGSNDVPLLESIDEELQASGGEGFEIKGFTSTDDMRLALANGQLDAASMPSVGLGMLFKRRPGVFASLVHVGEPKWFAWVTHRDSRDLRDYVSSRIFALRDSGELDELQMKWFGFTMEIPSDGYLPDGAL